ncbi:MAG TPA: histidine phosphatase family protein [Acidimicrobiales bacterium]|nr:histidine phosphatase family protein [Acidimicrobiales bacterium]
MAADETAVEGSARQPRPEVVLVRHGETARTIGGRHTGRTDVPLTEVGRHQAEHVAARLAERHFTVVLTSPLQRAADTSALAGFAGAEPSEDVVEWDYGAYEGRTTEEIRAERPGWSLWRDGVPGGETAAQVAERADRVVQRLRRAEGDALVFSHGHFLRVLAARWLGLNADAGRFFTLRPAGTSILGWEREQPVLARWNEPVG